MKVDFEFAFGRIVEIGNYINKLMKRRDISKERKQEIYESARGLQRYWRDKYFELKYGKA